MDLFSGLPDLGFIIPSYDVGTNYVPRDGLAMLHQGEAVVPKEYNDNGIIREASITINNHNYTADAARANAQETSRILQRRGIPGSAR